MELEYWILGILLCLSMRDSQGAGCRLDVFEKCFGVDFHILDDPSTMRRVCKPQMLLNSLVCISELKGRCEKVQGYEINTSDWPSAMTLYCDNIDLLMSNKECIQTARRDVQSCVPVSLQDLQERIGRRNSSVRGDQRLVLQTICEHRDERQTCFDQVISKTCPVNVWHILSKAFAKKTKATCIYGGFEAPPPTESSGRVTEEQPRPPTDIVPDKRQQQKDPDSNGVCGTSMNLLTLILSLNVLLLL